MPSDVHFVSRENMAATASPEAHSRANAAPSPASPMQKRESPDNLSGLSCAKLS